MTCSSCNKRLNIGMIHKRDPATGMKYKSCPHCSDANNGEHVYHPYPSSFGKTPARNPEGYQSYCIECRRLDKGVQSQTYMNGKTCSSLI